MGNVYPALALLIKLMITRFAAVVLLRFTFYSTSVDFAKYEKQQQ